MVMESLDAGHLLLIGAPETALDLATGLARGPGAALSVSSAAASAAMLERLYRSNRPLMVVDMELDLHAVRARLRGDRPDGQAGADIVTPASFERLVGRTVADVERELILQTLARCDGNRTSAATILGISVRTMRNKLKTFVRDGIPVAPAP